MRKILIAALALLFATSMVAVRASHTFADPRNFQLTNQNQTLSLTQVWVDVSGPGNFDTELLQGSTVGPGQSGTVVFDPNVDPGECNYDIKVVFSDGGSAEQDGINLCQTTQLNAS